MNLPLPPASEAFHLQESPSHEMMPATVVTHEESQPPVMETVMPEETPAVEERAPVAASESAPLPPMTLDLTAADLVQIETDPQKFGDAPDYEAPIQPRPPRIRPAASLTEDEPLEQIETRK